MEEKEGFGVPEPDKAAAGEAGCGPQAPERAAADLPEEPERLHKLLESGLSEVRAIDPDIRDLGDIMALETAAKFREYVVEKKLSLPEAYKLANMDRLAENLRRQAHTAPLAETKEHLHPTATRGRGSAAVPPEELALYRELLPGVSEARIQKHYNEYKKMRG